MPTELMDAVIALAKEAGWKIERFKLFNNNHGWQLKSPAGHYEQFGADEDTCWRKAYLRGLFDELHAGRRAWNKPRNEGVAGEGGEA